MLDVLPSLPQEAGATKFCTGCESKLPHDAFYARPCGKLSSRCKRCLSATNAARQRERYANDPDFRERSRLRLQALKSERMWRELDARRVAKEFAEAERQSEREAENRAELARRRDRYDRRRGALKRPLSPEKRQAAVARVAQLTALLKGTADERITCEAEWDKAVSELESLWLRSGDKVCTRCAKTVPPEQMHPPGPANFRPDHCHACSSYLWEDSYRRSSGVLIGPLPGPRRLRLRDGTTMTVSTFARRVAERQRGRRDQLFPK